MRPEAARKGVIRPCLFVSGIILVSSLIAFSFFACHKQLPAPNNKYARYFSLNDLNLHFEAPFSGVKNDAQAVEKTELIAGDFIRFPQTEETGEILRVIEITANYALIEYELYSAPPAAKKTEPYRFKIFPSKE